MTPKSDKIQGLPVDRGWAWMIVVGYFISTFFMVGLAKSFGILLTEFRNYFEIEVARAALVMAVSGAVYTITAPFCLAFGQYFTQRKVVIFGSIVGFVLISLSCFLLSIEYVIAFYGVGTGLANACFFGNGMVMIGTYFHDRRSLANGLSLTGASVGQFVIPPLLQYLLEEYTLKGTLLLVGALYLHIAMAGFLYRPPTFYTSRTNPVLMNDKTRTYTSCKSPASDDEFDEDDLVVHISNDKNIENNETIASEKHAVENHNVLIEMDLHPFRNNILHKRLRYLATSSGSMKMASIESLSHLALDEDHKDHTQKTVKKKNSVRICGKSVEMPKVLHLSVLKMPVVIFYIIVSFLVFFGYFNFVIFMPPDVLLRGVSKYDKALLVSCAGAGDLCGRLAVGILGDLNVIKRYKIMAFVCFFCGLTIFIFAFASSYWLLVLLSILYGILGGAYIAINAIVLIDLVGLELMPNALGMVLLIQGLGAATGQPILGYIRDETASYFGVNIINSIAMMLGAILLFCYPLVKKVRREKIYRVKDPDSDDDEKGTDMTKMVDRNIAD